MTIDRILGSFQTSARTSDQLIKVGVCIKLDIELLMKNEYYQCIRVGNNEPALLQKHKTSDTKLEYIFEQNTSLALQKYKSSVYYTVNIGDKSIHGEILSTIKRFMKPIFMIVSDEIDKISSFIKN